MGDSSVVANERDWDIVESKFEVQSHCYEQFQNNTLKKV